MLLSAVMLNMLIMLNVFELTGPSRCTPEKRATFNITAVRSIFFQKMLLSAEMLNMLNVFLNVGSLPGNWGGDCGLGGVGLQRLSRSSRMIQRDI